MANSKKQKTILEKEEEYMRINAELEQKTAALVKQADTLLKKSTPKQFSTPLLDRVGDFNDETLDHSMVMSEHEEAFQNDDNTDIKRKFNEIAEKCAKETEPRAVEPLRREDRDDESCLEVQNRYLKAKLRVLQEDNEKLAKDLLQKQEDFTGLQARVREIEEDRNRLQRANNIQASHLDKVKKTAEDTKTKIDVLEAQITTYKKETEQQRRGLDQQASAGKAGEVRLNRALEDAVRLKAQLAQARSGLRETADADKKRADQLQADNRRLERQRAELVQAFRKQMQLIDVLKRQKMQIEVAKMLQFTEEEFVKALDWEK